MNLNIEQKRKQLNLWLARDGLSRKDLATMLQVSEASVYNWLSCTNIPDRRWQEIRDIFETPKEPEEPRNRILGSNFSDSEVEKIKLAANGIQLEEYIRELVLRQIRQDLRLDD